MGAVAGSSILCHSFEAMAAEMSARRCMVNQQRPQTLLPRQQDSTLPLRRRCECASVLRSQTLQLAYIHSRCSLSSLYTLLYLLYTPIYVLLFLALQSRRTWQHGNPASVGTCPFLLRMLVSLGTCLPHPLHPDPTSYSQLLAPEIPKPACFRYMHAIHVALPG